ncbi:MAG: hypothetical protein CFH43_00995 [Proteobacteria bacterium]|nr:MAG: hypothetical protein CFH43_00995 [Pseudomonadota bacterium]
MKKQLEQLSCKVNETITNIDITSITLKLSAFSWLFYFVIVFIYIVLNAFGNMSDICEIRNGSVFGSSLICPVDGFLRYFIDRFYFMIEIITHIPLFIIVGLISPKIIPVMASFALSMGVYVMPAIVIAVLMFIYPIHWIIKSPISVTKKILITLSVIALIALATFLMFL